MKLKLPYYFLLFVSSLGFAQSGKNLISFSFSDLRTPQILDSISKTNDLKIFYLESWFDQNKHSGEYNNVSLDSLLEDLLDKSSINYFRFNDSTYVLTQNNRIYESLPPNFFQKSNSENTSQNDKVIVSSPVFVAQANDLEDREIETIRIGVENPNSKKQTYKLSGYIIDEESGRPVQDIAILITNRNRGTVTDEKGYYELNLPQGIQEFKTQFIGMKPVRKRIILYNDGELNLNVKEGVEQLVEVVVEADRYENVEEVITGTNRIDSEESKDIPVVLGERDILQVAATLPGISRSGEGAIGLNVRGGKADQNQFLLNSAIVYNPTHFFGIFQALNPFVTDHVDIYKGSIPVEFGGRLSSVFDIKTVAGDTEKLKGQGSIGPVTANLAFEIPVKEKRSSFVVGGRATYSDWILKALDEESLKNSEANFYDFIGTYRDQINENNSIKATGYYSKDRFTITPDSLINYSNRAFSIEWFHNFNDNNRATVTLANSRYAFNINYDSDFNNQDFDYGYWVKESELRAWNEYRLNDKHRIKYGLSAKYYNMNPGSIEPNNSESRIESRKINEEQALEGGIFISDEIKLTDNFTIDAGLRYSVFAALGPSDQYNYEEDQPRNVGTISDSTSYGGGELMNRYGGPEVRFSARYLITPNLSLRGGYSNMYQYIHTLSNTTTISPIDTWKLSDNNIRPQKQNQVSLGLFKNFDDAEYEVSLEGFYKWSKDVLDFKTGARILLNDHVETEVIQGDGLAYGVEFMLQKKRGNLNGWFSYTYSRSKVRFDSQFPEEQINNGEFFPSNYDRPHDISLVANYKFTRRYSLSLNFAYQTGRPITYPIGQYYYNNAEYVFYSDRNKYRIPENIRLDIGFNVEGNHKIKKLAHSFWTVSVYNVLGRNNPYSVYFVTDNGELKALQSSIFAVPIPTITYNFKF
ncbi:Outer membrane receptor proteins, mostly Fe transport [Flavobacteriaceae bacterium MAR_2010_188]|nr:Outer membrane receptor proteins, mostly Fe transport [Flavobacteriaceae bacterium MAR_2010_188]